MKKWISRIIDIVLVLIIGVLGYVQISMLVTPKSNHGVPSAFGMSFLYVVTDSMEDPDNPNSIDPGTGIIIIKTNPKDIRTSNPIYDEKGDLIGYDKTGDVVTFYYDLIKAPDTHRVIGSKYNEEKGLYEFQTMGDNPIAHQKWKIETWDETKLIGKVLTYSKQFGWILSLVSPAAAASAGKSPWFMPVAIISLIATIAIISGVDAFVKYRKENKKREAELQQMMIDAGIDLNDEMAVELFRAKEEVRLDIKEQMEEEKEKIKKQMLKEQKKQLKKKENNEKQ